MKAGLIAALVLLWVYGAEPPDGDPAKRRRVRSSDGMLEFQVPDGYVRAEAAGDGSLVFTKEEEHRKMVLSVMNLGRLARFSWFRKAAGVAPALDKLTEAYQRALAGGKASCSHDEPARAKLPNGWDSYRATISCVVGEGRAVIPNIVFFTGSSTYMLRGEAVPMGDLEALVRGGRDVRAR